MRVIVIAGPNGAGKTSFAKDYLHLGVGSPPFVNGDEIAARLSPSDPGAVALEAGRIALQRMEACVTEGKDFAIETTLSGRRLASRFGRWKASGYRVTMIYLRLASADQAVERVAQRVAEGGHQIPEAVVRRRFGRSRGNFRRIYQEIADDWQVYDNSGQAPILVAQSDGRPLVREKRIPMTEHPRFPEGEPSTESVLAALIRARDHALARAAAVRERERAEGPVDEAESADSPADGVPPSPPTTPPG